MQPATSPDQPPLLSARRLSVRFGGVHALSDLDLDVARSEICGLIGPNGAGKTTLFNALTAIVRPTGGVISFNGRRLDRIARRKVISAGLARTFQNLGLFNEMTVLENVSLGAHHNTEQYRILSILNPLSFMTEERRLTQISLEAIELVGISPARHEKVGSLPYPILKRVEIARALASRPRLLLLDEPAAGMTQRDVHELEQLLETVKQTLSIAIVLVEHHIGLVMRLCSRVVVLHLGRKIADGPPSTVRDDPTVIQAYLGTPRG